LLEEKLEQRESGCTQRGICERGIGHERHATRVWRKASVL
jgi:hypothetical protein